MPGVTKDPNSYDITVELEDNGDGTLTVTPTYPEGGLVISNSYAATGSLTLAGAKTLTGRELGEGDDFTFTVKDQQYGEVYDRSRGNGNTHRTTVQLAFQ